MDGWMPRAEIILYEHEKCPKSYWSATLQIYEEDYSIPLKAGEAVVLCGDRWLLEIKFFQEAGEPTFQYLMLVGEPECDDEGYFQALKDWATQVCELLYGPPSPSWEIGD